MSNGGDAAEQIVKISLDGVDYAIRIVGAGAKNLSALLMALAKSKKSQPPHLKVTGQERLKRMLKSGRPLDVFSVREQDIRVFSQEAKKYGIVYCAVRDKVPKADGMIDVLIRKEDSPKINRVMELLEYGAVDKTNIKSEIVKAKAGKGAEPSAPDKSDSMDVDSFLDSILPGEGQSKEGRNQAVQPPTPENDAQEVRREDFFTPLPDRTDTGSSSARTKPNPSERGSDNTGRAGETISDVNEYEHSSYSDSHGEQVVNDSSRGVRPPSVKEEIRQIRAELKEQAQNRKDEPSRGKKAPQQTTRHRQPDTARKSKSKNVKER